MRYHYGLTARKLTNYLACAVSRRLKHHVCAGMPTRLFIEATNHCNLRCSFCATGLGVLRRPKATMSLGRFKKIIDETHPYLFEINFSGYGEPLLNDDIAAMVAYAKSKRMRVWFPTNALLLDEKRARHLIEAGLDQITVSLDSATEEGYRTHKRAGSLKESLQRLSMLHALKKQMRAAHPLVRINFVLMKHNEDEVAPARQIARAIGAEIFAVKPANMDVSGYGAEKIKQETGIESSAHARTVKKQALRFTCPWLWNTMMIFADGNVAPCCFDAHGSHRLGNVYEASVRSVWNGDAFRRMRENVARDMEAIALCAQCPARYEYEV